MDNNLISVILPVYNGEKFLRDSIESILNQTYESFELIIINDGSTDGSLNIINEYACKDSRIKVISRENKGLVYSLNEGIDLAKGKYIARMDADDISLSQRFELQYKYLEEHTDIAILGTFIESFGEDKKTSIMLEQWFNEKLNDENMYIKTSYSCPIAHPTVMMRTRFAKLERYSSKYPVIEDYELWIRVLKKGYKISNIDMKLLKYRVHSKSKSNIEKGEIAIRQRIECKLNYLFDADKKNVILWGAGLGGRMFINYVLSSKWNKKINIMAVVDKEKEGKIENIDIIKPHDIDKIRYDYIFITTSLGYREVSSYLNKKGLKILEDYMYPV